MKRLLIVAAVLVFAQPAAADVYMRSKSFMGGEIESWTTPTKQRSESNVPVMGKLVTVTRTDKGVEWTINATKGIYDEKPIAFSYPPPETATAQKNAPSSGFGPDMGQEEEFKEPVVTKLNRQKNISGIIAEGYSIAEKGKPADMIVWIAPKGSVPESIDREMNAYSRAYLNAQYANYPDDERQEMLKWFSGFGNMFMNMFAAAASVSGDIPQGVMLGMESTQGFGNGQPAVMFEVLELKSVNVNPQMFDLPGGLARVDDVSQATAMRTINGEGNADMGAMLQQIQSMATQAQGVAGEAGGMDDAGSNFDPSSLNGLYQTIGGQNGGEEDSGGGVQKAVNVLEQLQQLQQQFGR